MYLLYSIIHLVGIVTNLAKQWNHNIPQTILEIATFSGYVRCRCYSKFLQVARNGKNPETIRRKWVCVETLYIRKKN